MILWRGSPNSISYLYTTAMVVHYFIVDGNAHRSSSSCESVYAFVTDWDIWTSSMTEAETVCSR